MDEEPENVTSSVLEPPPPGATVLGKWMAWLVAANAAGLLWLAVREDSPEGLRAVLDNFWRVLQGGAVAFVAYRMLVQFPFRLLDLLLIVFLLSLGVMASLEALKNIERLTWLWDRGGAFENDLGPQIQASLLGSSMLLAGAALGLRYCLRLKIESPGRRAWAIVAGMLVFPALTGFIALPPLLLPLLLGARDQGDEAAACLLGWFCCTVLVAFNAFYFIRSLALEAEVDRTSRQDRSG